MMVGAATPSTAYTVSMFMRKGPVANGFIQINATGGATVVSAAYYDLTNGTAVVGADIIAGLTNKSVSITNAGNGWYRCSFTFTTTATNNSIGMYPGPCTIVSSSGDNRSAVGVVGQGIFAWGAQIEVGAFPTSYLPTTAAAVTRSSDQCSLQPAQMGFYTPPGGSWMAELIPAYFPGSYPRVVFLWPTVGGAAPVMFDTSVPGKGGQYDGTSILTTANATPAGTIAKIATTATASNGSQCLNGGTVSSAALAGGGYPTLGTTGVGFLCASGASPSNTVGWLRRVRYWPRVLSNAELQSVTT